MKSSTKKLFLSAISGIGILSFGCQDKANEASAVEAEVTEISNNLDLKVVISVFGESKDLEDFENKLNDPERQVSNLDLNGDGEVDYLRVVESSKDQTHLINVQAVTGQDQYQDVATFDVERDKQGQTQVQVVGDPYVYGPNYGIRPAFTVAPLIAGFLWGSSYRSWRSPYQWNNYPPSYRSWRPYNHRDYRNRVSRYHNSNYSYHYGPYKRNRNSVGLYNQSRRNDYGSRHPNRSFAKRNKGVENHYKLEQKKGKNKVKGANNKGHVSTQKPGNKPLKPGNQSAKPGNRPSNPGSKPSKPGNKPSNPGNKPAAKPGNKPSNPGSKPSKPGNKPSNPGSKPSKPGNKPSKPGSKPSKPGNKPAAKPGNKQSKPAGKPAGKPSGKSGGKQGGKKDKGKK